MTSPFPGKRPFRLFYRSTTAYAAYMSNCDWKFVQKILDLSEGHNNTKRARLIITVLTQLRQLRHAGPENENYPLDCRVAVGYRKADLERGLVG
jgi:hypothetical protein